MLTIDYRRPEESDKRELIFYYEFDNSELKEMFLDRIRNSNGAVLSLSAKQIDALKQLLQNVEELDDLCRFPDKYYECNEAVKC